MVTSKTTQKIEEAKNQLELHSDNVRTREDALQVLQQLKRRTSDYLATHENEYKNTVKNRKNAEVALATARSQFESAKAQFETADRAVKNSETNPTFIKAKNELPAIEKKMSALEKELVLETAKMQQALRDMNTFQAELLREKAELLKKARLNEETAVVSKKKRF